MDTEDKTALNMDAKDKTVLNMDTEDKTALNMDAKDKTALNMNAKGRTALYYAATSIYGDAPYNRKKIIDMLFLHHASDLDGSIRLASDADTAEYIRKKMVEYRRRVGDLFDGITNDISAPEPLREVLDRNQVPGNIISGILSPKESYLTILTPEERKDDSEIQNNNNLNDMKKTLMRIEEAMKAQKKQVQALKEIAGPATRPVVNNRINNAGKERRLSF